MKLTAFATTFSFLLALSSAAVSVPRNQALIKADASDSNFRALPFSHTSAACEKEDDDDCKEFCKLNQQTYKCTAAGNKVTCSCKGGKSESKCEERCLLCMPDKSAMEEAKRVFNLA